MKMLAIDWYPRYNFFNILSTELWGGSPGLYMFTNDGGASWNRQIFISTILSLMQ